MESTHRKIPDILTDRSITFGSRGPRLKGDSGPLVSYTSQKSVDSEGLGGSSTELGKSPNFFPQCKRALNTLHARRRDRFSGFLFHCFSGFLSDITSTYNEAFYFSGASIAVCTCVLSLVPVFTPMRRPGPTEVKMKSDELEGKKRRPSFLEKYVQRYFRVLQEDPGEVVECLVVVDKETAV